MAAMTALLTMLAPAVQPLAASDVPAAMAAGAGPPTPLSLDQAPIAVMEDLGSGRVLYSREADRRFLPASLTKLMTVYTAFELLDEGTLTLNQTLPVRDETFREWSNKGSTMFVARGSRISVETLLRGIMTVSANDGCIVLAEGAAGSVAGFTALMNAKAKALGMDDSHFNTPNGWPDEGRTFTSGRDLATLARAILTRHPEKYARYFGIPQFTYSGITQKNRNPILGVVRGADGMKTGFTNEAGYGFVGSAERDGRRLVMVVAGTDSARARKAIARDFIAWGFDAWDSQRLFGNRQTVGFAAVQGGADRQVPLITSQPVFATSSHGEAVTPSAAIHYFGPLKAPIVKDQPVAELLITVDGMPGRAIPLLAGHDVAPANFWQRLRNGLLGLFA